MRQPPGGPASARRARLRLNLLTVVGLLGLLAAVSLSAPRWSRWLRQPLPAADDDSGAAPVEVSPAPVREAQRTIQVKLFFESADGGGLVLEQRSVSFERDLARQIEVLVRELLQGPQGAFVAPLPSGTKVLTTLVTGRGTAYVSLSKEALESEVRGSRSELLSVYALVDSIVANFPAVSRVQLLIEDRPVDTLWGHVDLSRPLPGDMSLLAAAELTPAAPEAAPATVPGPTPAAEAGR